MSHLVNIKCSVVDLDDRLRALEKRLAIAVNDHEKLVKDKTTQEYLDYHIQGLTFQECANYYESIRETTDVYMVPFDRVLNPNYKFWHPSVNNGGVYTKAEYKDTIRPDYAALNTTWLAAKKQYDESTKISNPYPEYSKHDFANPEHKYNCSAWSSYVILGSMDKNPMKTIFGIDLCRIYTKATWEKTIPKKIRNMFDFMYSLIEHNKEDHRHIWTVSKNPDVASMMRQHFEEPNGNDNYHANYHPFTGFQSHIVNCWIELMNEDNCKGF
jgi:hypothetical protein